MGVFSDKVCDGCTLRQQTIDDLREALKDAQKTLLAVADKPAYRMLYGPPPKPTGPTAHPEPMPPAYPGAVPWVPPMGQSHEEIERQFVVGQSIEAAASGVTPITTQPSLDPSAESAKLDDAMAHLMRQPLPRPTR